jgi:hypothetical protein
MAWFLWWIGLLAAYLWHGPHLWLLVIVLIATVLSAASLAKFIEYVKAVKDQELMNRQRAMTTTADAEIFRTARELAAQSPELAGEIAKRFGRPDLILLPHRDGKKAQVKLAGCDVTLEFAVNALNKSSQEYYCAQRNYSDGTYHYDSNKEISDRKQWMQFNFVLARDGICTRYVPGASTNESPMWIPPWTAERVRDNWLFPPYLMEILKPLMPEPDENQAEAA